MRLKQFYIMFLFVLLFVLIGCKVDKPSNHYVDFKSNGGSYVETFYGIENQTIAKPNDPIKVGYTFDGWYIDQELTKRFSFDTLLERNIILYAKWIKKTYTITFETNGGNIIDPITLEHGAELTLPVPIKESDFFVGWFKDVNLNEYYQTTQVPNSNLTLYAKWTDDETIADKELYRQSINESIQEAVRNHFGPYYIFNFLPPKGDVNVLVIPIQFPNDRFLSSEMSRIEDAFFGDGSQFETVKSFYHESSYGVLNLSGSVLSPYTAKFNYNYYDDYRSPSNEESMGVDLLIEEAITYYTQSNSGLDLSDYDFDKDQFLDGVYFIYSAPINNDLENSIYWAYQSHYSPTKGNDNHFSLNNYRIFSYIFSGVDFLIEEDKETSRVLIHETGHLLGLADYYDYTEGVDQNIGGLGGSDMMDNNYGDHNSFSKLILDWIDPIVINESKTLQIDRFSTSGDSIIISRDFSSIFGDYFIMNYFTPTGLNTDNLYLNESGLMMYSVNSSLPDYYDTISDYSSYFINNNSDTINKLISIVEADGRNDISKYNDFTSNSDLLHVGEDFILKDRYGEFCRVQVIEQTLTTITLKFEFFED